MVRTYVEDDCVRCGEADCGVLSVQSPANCTSQYVLVRTYVRMSV